MTEAEKVAAIFDEIWAKEWLTFPTLRQPLKSSSKKGVYIVADRFGNVLHVGNTPRAAGGIEQRLKDHMAGRSSFAKQYLKPKGIELRGECLYCYKVISSPRLMALVEAYAIGQLCPAHLGTYQYST